MISYRSRKYYFFVLDSKSHKVMIEWKKTSRNKFNELPGELFYSLLSMIGKYFAGFDYLTVPAPSFHKYDHYPIYEIAIKLGCELNMQVLKLFPNNSGKTKMTQFGSIGKHVQDIECPPGKFILILDDILTTGHTLRVSCEAIARKNSYPAAIAIA